MSVKGNKNAEKWTKKEALKFVQKVEEYIQENKDEYHLGLTCKRCGGYPDLWSYLANKFNEEESVFRTIKNVEVELEARIVKGTMTGELKSAAMAIFYIKNKHGYKDKNETEISGQQDIIIDFSE